MLTVCMRARCPGVHLRVVIIVLSESLQLVAGVSIKTLGADPRAGLGWAGWWWFNVRAVSWSILVPVTSGPAATFLAFLHTGYRHYSTPHQVTRPQGTRAHNWAFTLLLLGIYFALSLEI